MKVRQISAMVGVTLLEIMLVLAIAAVITLLSVRYYQQATTQTKITQATQIASGVLIASETFYNSHNGTYAGLDLATYMGRTPVSPWGGNVTATATTSKETTSFSFNIPGIPTVPCSVVKDSIEASAVGIGGTCDGKGLTVLVTRAS